MLLDYTITAFNKTIEDFRKATWIGTLVMQIVYILYLSYTLFSRIGYFWVNLILLILSVSYLTFFLVTKFRNLKDKLRKIGRRIYKYSKLFINFLTLGGTLFTLATADIAEIKPLSIVLITLTIIMWVLQFILEIATPIVENRIDLIKTALETDVDNALKPIRATGNFFKKMVGKEVVEEEVAPTKARILLDKLVAERRQLKAQQKQEKKVVKQAEKLLSKEKVEIEIEEDPKQV